MKLIPLTQGKFAQVDDEDYEFLMQFKWQAIKGSNSWYAKRGEFNGKNMTNIPMHRQLLGITDPKVYGDHIDHDGLNNQRNNLRIATPKQNAYNRKAKKSTSSKYLGVCLVKSINGYGNIYYYWKVSIDIGEGKKLTKFYANTPENEIIAAKQYDVWAKELHGEFAALNFPGAK